MEPDEESTIKSNPMEFKKPVLIGKVGRLPRKMETKDTSENTSAKRTDETDSNTNEIVENEINPIVVKPKPPLAPAQLVAENIYPLPYKEPSWSGLPQSNGKNYQFEVLKSGKIIEDIDLMKKPYWVFGRLGNCDMCMAHPTISRYHAVLQYRSEPSEDLVAGFYLYDLNSTHGTFLNKNRIKPRVYARVQVGHLISLGCSTRTYFLNGPEDDVEAESELSVTELKQLRAEKLLQREQEAKETALKAEAEKEEKRKKDEQAGIDWGMGEDAEEESDLTENPFAQTNNEELYLDDPKKALRGFMEREGHELEYDCTEQGMGQFLCKVELPIDDERGRPIVAEVLHKGKKKEAVVQCALEACRILDRYGVLRQATHESRKRKAKNWEENDFYDSDDDIFLDRTGTVEKKRENRMKAKLPQQPETYQSLLEKENKIAEEIALIEKQLTNSSKASKAEASTSKEEDSLESFMKGLSNSKLDKQTVSKLKSELLKLKLEHAQVIKLVNIARPADLPPLVAQYNSESSKPGSHTTSKGLPLFGKRKKVKVQLPEKPKVLIPDHMEVEESEDDEEITEKSIGERELENPNRVGSSTRLEESSMLESSSRLDRLGSAESLRNSADSSTLENSSSSNQISSDAAERLNQRNFNRSTVPGSSRTSDSSDRQGSDSDNALEHINIIEGRDNIPEPRDVDIKSFATKYHLDLQNFNVDMERFREIFGSSISKFKELDKIIEKIKVIVVEEDKMQMYGKILAVKTKKLMKQMLQLSESDDPRLEYKVAAESHRILIEINNIIDHKSEVLKTIKEINKEYRDMVLKVMQELLEIRDSYAKEDAECSQNNGEASVDSDLAVPSTSGSCLNECDSNQDLEKKKKKNQRRIQQRSGKAEMEKQKGYEEDAEKDDYNMWVPPEGQSGDGRTSLNDKLGY